MDQANIKMKMFHCRTREGGFDKTALVHWPPHQYYRSHTVVRSVYLCGVAVQEEESHEKTEDAGNVQW